MMRNTTNCLLLLLSVFVFGGCGKTGTQVSPSKGSEKIIKSFVFNSLNPAVQCTIDNSARTITAVLPNGTNINSLAPTITVSDNATVSPGSSVAQDFTSPVSYTVTAKDGSRQTYTTNITVGGTGSSGSGTIVTIAGNGSRGFSGDGGQATDAQLNICTDVAVDAAGNLYLSDASNLRIRKVTPSGIITTFAGNGSSGSAGDGGQASAASFSLIAGLALDAAGNIYVACADRVRRISTSGIITNVAGSGSLVTPNKGDGGQATDAALNQPRDLAVNAAGDLFITDWGNHRVRKVSKATGIITTILGNGSLSDAGDGGPSTAATMKYPRGIALDAAGNIYISNSYFIRKINTSGIVSTFAGSSTVSTYVVDGNAATSGRLGGYGITIDGNGDLLVPVNGQPRIRKINTATGIVTTVAGGAYVFGDGGPATDARLTDPTDVAVDGAGNIYIADYNDWRVRKVIR